MIPKLIFGRTGHESTRTLFGAAALGRRTQAEADATLEVLLAHGVNHIDTAASYGDSELRIGPWMAQHRQHFFLATKTGKRAYAEAREEFHRSLERLRVDSVDLLQLHNLVDPAEWEMAMGDEGALRAAIEAREEGLLRFIGVTGHGVVAPRMHLRSLERFDFDSVLLPCNYLMLQDPQYAADFQALVALCRERNVAVQTIKSIARGPWGEKEHIRTTWYEPLEEQEDIDRAVHWVLGQPGLFLNTAGDIDLLPRILDAAERFAGPPCDDEMRAMVAKRGMVQLFPRE
ncbi:MAG: aldo/keto reductase [Chloroflexi bacterium]|nr:aldo/keto reductase [Chloroflexota bacterium]